MFQLSMTLNTWHTTKRSMEEKGYPIIWGCYRIWSVNKVHNKYETIWGIPNMNFCLKYFATNKNKI